MITNSVYEMEKQHFIVRQLKSRSRILERLQVSTNESLFKQVAYQHKWSLHEISPLTALANYYRLQNLAQLMF